MSLEQLLSEQGSAIREAWFRKVLAAYPEEYRNYIKGNRNPFANPVGATFQKGLEDLFEAVAAEENDEKYRAALDPIVRVKAVQDAPPSAALAFLPLLKSVVREFLGEAIRQEDARRDLRNLEARIDRATLLAFDAYTECREKIFRIRVNEIKRNTERLMGGRASPPEAAPPPTDCGKTCNPEGGGSCQ